MDAPVQVHEWILVFFSVVFIGLLIAEAVNRFLLRKRNKQITELRVEKNMLEDEVTYLIRIHRYKEPVTIDVGKLSGIRWSDMLKQGTSCFNVDAAVRVHYKFTENMSIHGVKNKLYLDPEELRLAYSRHHHYIALINSALGQQSQQSV